jgi:hypothetical protein
MTTQNLLIVDGPSELDLYFSVARKATVSFTVQMRYGQGFKIDILTVLDGFHPLDSKKKTFAITGQVIARAHDISFDIKEGLYFLAKCNYSSGRHGEISLSEIPRRKPWDDAFPCLINYGQDYFELLRVSCLNYDPKSIIRENLFGQYADKGEQKSGIREVSFRLALPHEVLGKKTEDDYGLSWKAEDFRPATKLEHMAFAIRYPEEQRFFNIVCFSSHVQDLGRYFLYLREGALDLVDVLERFSAENDWRVLAVPKSPTT